MATIAAQAQTVTLQIGVTNQSTQLQLPRIPGVDEFSILSTTNLTVPFAPDSSGALTGYLWTGNKLGSVGFYQLGIKPMAPDAVEAATLLNRIAYGPTPDELDRVLTLGPEAYIAEQLALENIQETLPIDKVNSTGGWQYITATASGNSSILYLYLNDHGDGYIDDMVLVKGSVPEVGTNLLQNGGFEQAITTNNWNFGTNYLSSNTSTAVAHSGSASLHIEALFAGTTSQGSSIWQAIVPALSSSQTYTLSYWYLPGAKRARAVARLGTSGINGTSDTLLMDRLLGGLASIDDLRSWHVQRAVGSKKQLLEVLLQFLDNHFVTQWSKANAYLQQYYQDPSHYAARMEFQELQRWRQALLNPQCTFYDLLKVSAESPAMIIYLDTVNSVGSGTKIANENYARELLELFTFGVDNGYDQNDITVESRAWTGWSINFVDATNEFNPFAAPGTNQTPGTVSKSITNLVGVWAFNYKQANHNTTIKTIFPKKTVPARFGPPYAGRNYELVIPSRTGTNGIQDGYQVIAHMANQPFTQEFISVKLCRLFVHDDFAIGYDFTDPNLSPEGQLVRQCMAAWENGSPQGQIRQVLATIFNSELFKAQGASMQKVRTPLEFTVATIRALRAANTNGTYTADTDGFALVGPMGRMGSMNLFDRAEPDGYPEAAAPWISAGTLAERLRFVQSVCLAPGAVGKSDAGAKNVTDPVALLKMKLPSSAWNDAAAVADYFLHILFPGEGRANLNEYKTQAVTFLNTTDAGTGPSPFNLLANTSASYDTRVRGMVAMLMTLQRFQEQ